MKSYTFQCDFSVDPSPLSLLGNWTLIFLGSCESFQTINSLNVFRAPLDGLCAKFFAKSFAQKYTQTYLLLQTYSVFVPSPFMAMWELNIDRV